MNSKMVIKPHTSPTLTTSKKTIIIFSTFALFGIMLASFFIVTLYDLPNKKRNGLILVKNPSFEKWKRHEPVGWKNVGARLIIENKNVIEGNLSVGIYNDSKEKKGIVQKIKLDPLEIYNVCYSMKSNKSGEELAGVVISYEGDDVRATTEAADGLHFHENGKKWVQYFGRVTGANSVTLFFFSKDNSILFVDGIGLGVNVMPDNMMNDTVSL